jgi:hypothetical protein
VFVLEGDEIMLVQSLVPPQARFLTTIHGFRVFPGESQLSAEQQEGMCWIAARMANVASLWKKQMSPDEEELVNGFLNTIVAIINLRNQLVASTPPAAESVAEQVLDVLDEDLVSFLEKCNGFDLPRFRALAEGMMLALAYADLHEVLWQVKKTAQWHQLRAGSEFLDCLKGGLCRYVPEEDAKQLVQIAALKELGGVLQREDVHRATIEALSVWRDKSRRWVEGRLGLLKMPKAIPSDFIER